MSTNDGEPTLLVVEDEYLVRWALATEARERGYRVIEAEDTANARAALAEGVDVALLDCRLPDGDGMALLDEIQQAWHVPVIVMTAQGSVPEAVEAMHRGAFHYVTKPVEPSQVLALAEEALRRGDRTVGPGGNGAGDGDGAVAGDGAASGGGASAGDGQAFLLPQQGVVLDDVERSLLSQALARTRGNRSQAARLLGITRNQLRYRIKKFDLDAPQQGA